MKLISGNKFLKKENEQIIVDEISLNKFLNKFDTPLILFLENKIRDNIRTFIEVFRSTFKNFHCYYSFKANYLPEICKIILSEGIGAELISLPELNLALKLGFPPNKILVGGPYLPIEIIKRSIEIKVKEIIIYNLKDIYRIDSIAKKYNVIQNICIRINSEKYNSRLGIKLTNKNLDLLRDIKNKCKNISFSSILSHYSTQMNNIKFYEKNIKNLAQNAKKLKELGIKFEGINLGGGFPEACVMPQKQLKDIAFNMKAILDQIGINFKHIYLEPGRYFVGDAGILIAKVIKITEDRWVYLNIGNHICPKFAKASTRFYNATRISQPHKFKVSISGIIPTDQDVLAKNYFFTETILEDDIILITNIGAYCLTFSNRFPYPLPKILLVKGNSSKKIFDPIIDKDFSIN
ncbi:MAG: diaminopimelate decarboxylase family protein [Promethearchaeota archaeon]